MVFGGGRFDLHQTVKLAVPGIVRSQLGVIDEIRLSHLDAGNVLIAHQTLGDRHSGRQTNVLPPEVRKLGDNFSTVAGEVLLNLLLGVVSGRCSIVPILDEQLAGYIFFRQMDDRGLLFGLPLSEIKPTAAPQTTAIW